MKVKNLNSHIEHIVTGYKHQYQRYTELLKLSQQLEDMIKAKDISGVETAVAKKGEIIQNIKEIEGTVMAHKEDVMSLLHLKEFNLAKVSELIRANLLADLEKETMLIQQVIQEIVALDRRNEEGIRSLMQSLGKELKSIHQHFGIQQAYLDRPEIFPEPRFFDKRK